jgi:isocitrate/isopropylmalate dehydrogenase
MLFSFASAWPTSPACACFRYKWDTLPAEQRPERGLLALRAGLSAFANLRPATVLPQLAESSTLKPEVSPRLRPGGVEYVVIIGVTQAFPCLQLHHQKCGALWK